MEDQITSIIRHMAKSHQEMAEIIEATRHISTQMAQIINDIPDTSMNFHGVESVTTNSIDVAKSVTSYLFCLAEFQEAIADNLTCVMKEMNPENEE